MYLEHFSFKELPFSLTPDTGFFCQLKGHQEALTVLQFSLKSGEGFIKIIGEVGAGKTLLCRKLLDSLTDDVVTAYIPNPDLQPAELRKALAHELGIEVDQLADPHELLALINHRLLELHRAGKRIVFLIDEAQALPLESLETLRLFTNLETEKNKLLQVVLFGQPELDEHLNLPRLRQLKQRITFSYYLPLMTREDLDTYLFHRLAIVGGTFSALFTKKSRDLLYQASQGIPRIVNILCHKALLTAYGKGETTITAGMMNLAIRDTDVAVKSKKLWRLLFWGAGLIVVVLFAFLLYAGLAE